MASHEPVHSAVSNETAQVTSDSVSVVTGSASYSWDWLTEIVQSFFPWPFVVLFVFVILFFSRRSRNSLRGFLHDIGLRKLSFSGTVIELGTEGQREVQITFADAVQTINQYKKGINREVRRQVNLTDLDARLAKLYSDHIRQNLKESEIPKGFRCTIHIPDFLYDDKLYQMLNYFPNGKGAYRDFPSRYGIIGRVWRSERPECVGQLLEPRDLEQAKNEQDRVQLIAKTWGMTYTEAMRASDKPSYCCILLRFNERRVGLFYMDSPEKDAFGIDESERQKMIDDIIHGCEAESIPEIVSQIIGQLDPYSPRIVFD